MMNAAKSRNLTSNEYYGGLNRRFERRAARLRSLGFRYERVAEGVAAFTRRRAGKTKVIPAALVAHADRRAWTDRLRDALA